MNSLMMAIAMRGDGISPATLKSIQAARQRSYEKLTAFIRFLVITLVQGYYWLKKHPDIVLKDSTGAATKTPDFTGEGTQALINEFWSRRDQKDFIVTLLQQGADMLIEWLKPDPYEMEMWGAVLHNPSPMSALPDVMQNQQATLSQLISMLQQSQPVNTGSSTGSSTTAVPAPMPAGWTYDQYVAHYGYAPPATKAVGMTSTGAAPNQFSGIRGRNYL